MRRHVDRVGIAFGIFALLAGVAIGYLMLAYPQNISPAYPIWTALLVPLALISGGLLICAHALALPRFVAITFWAVALGLLVIVNWAALFSSHIQCRQTLSFLGVGILERYPSEAECRAGLRVIMTCLDAVVVVPFAVIVGRKLATRHRRSAESRQATR